MTLTCDARGDKAWPVLFSLYFDSTGYNVGVFINHSYVLRCFENNDNNNYNCFLVNFSFSFLIKAKKKKPLLSFPLSSRISGVCNTLFATLQLKYITVIFLVGYLTLCSSLSIKEKITLILSKNKPPMWLNVKTGRPVDNHLGDRREDYWIGQMFACQLWLANGPQEWFMFSYWAWLLIHAKFIQKLSKSTY